jgi:hypothetical protein
VEAHVLYQDVIPYATPRSLDALRGPAQGVVVLPRSVYWGPDPSANLDTRSGLHKAYRNLIREGTTDLQEALLNADILRAVWPELALPARCRGLWESRFPELRR